MHQQMHFHIYQYLILRVYDMFDTTLISLRKLHIFLTLVSYTAVCCITLGVKLYTRNFHGLFHICHGTVSEFGYNLCRYLYSL